MVFEFRSFFLFFTLAPSAHCYGFIQLNCAFVRQWLQNHTWFFKFETLFDHLL